MIDGLLTRVRGLWGWVVALWGKVKERWNSLLAFLHKEDDNRAVAARWVIAIALFFVALAVLIGLNYLLRGAGLWGDLGFAIVVTTAVFWILRGLASVFLGESDVKALPRAFATTIFVLVGFPVAWVTRWAGLALLFLPVLIWAVAQFVYWLVDRKKPKPRPKRRFPIFWQAEVAGVALLAIVLFVAPSVGSADRVPVAVEAADTEAGERGLELAERFRPYLYFDSAERFYPVDIQDAIAAKRVDMCRKAVGDDNCSTVEKAELIDANQDYLQFEDTETSRGGDDTSAIYYHVIGPRDDGRVYVDYWWFYSLNPSPVAGKVFCGPGLRTPPFTCQQHAGDWEGLTVVLAPCDSGAPDCETVDGQGFAPEEIRYGQHEFVVAYDWGEVLTPYWDSLGVPRAAQAVQDAWEGLVLPQIEGAGPHAIAFVARNSHASYPNPCFGGCKQATRELFEADHNGAVPWVHNETCNECVKPLPVTRGGDPALWNAFPGRWGEQDCILAGAYCDLSGAPKGPAFQERYELGGRIVQICRSGAIRLERCS